MSHTFFSTKTRRLNPIAQIIRQELDNYDEFCPPDYGGLSSEVIYNLTEEEVEVLRDFFYHLKELGESQKEHTSKRLFITYPDEPEKKAPKPELGFGKGDPFAKPITSSLFIYEPPEKP